jgi:hypothetical protein
MSLLATLTADEVREASPALYQAIGQAYASANPVTETVRETDGEEV